MNEEEFDDYITWEERIIDKLENWVKYDVSITRKQAEETIDFICEQDNVIEKKCKEIERLNNIINELEAEIQELNDDVTWWHNRYNAIVKQNDDNFKKICNAMQYIEDNLIKFNEVDMLDIKVVFGMLRGGKK